MDDLDQLLNDLSKPQPGASTLQAPRPSSPVDLQELESLMNDLTADAETKKAVPQQSQSTRLTTTELDDLLNTWSAPQQNTNQNAPQNVVSPSTPKTQGGLDDLEQLMQDLNKAPPPPSSSVSARSSMMPTSSVSSLPSQPPQPSRVTNVKSSIPTPPPSTPASTTKSSSSTSTSKTSTTTSSLPKKSSPSESPSTVVKKPTPTTTTTTTTTTTPTPTTTITTTPAPNATVPPQKRPPTTAAVAKTLPTVTPKSLSSNTQAVSSSTTQAAISSTLKPAPKENDGFEALMKDLTPSALATQTKGDDDLDTLMKDLTSGTPSPTVAATPPPSKSKDTADELDTLMKSLSSGSMAATSNVSTAPRVSTAVATPPMTTSPSAPLGATLPPPPSAARTPSPSISKAQRQDLDSLLTNLNEELKDVNTTTPSAQGLCATCRKPILGAMVQAMGRAYHPDHFNCASCGNPLGTGTFYEQEGQPHCERCYQAHFCPKCAHCNNPITDRCLTALGRQWHVNCFVCTQCLAPFEGGNFFERDHRPYCEKCFYEVFAPRCRSCNQPIRGDCINALGAQWHIEHFNCHYCHKSFGSGAFYEFEGMPYCELHYHQQTGSMCASCNQPITGGSITALGKKWHPEHFICVFCMNPLSGVSYTLFFGYNQVQPNVSIF
jgi:hypothetical protein